MIEQHFLLEGGVEYHGGHHTQDENKTRGQIEPGLFQGSQAHADLFFPVPAAELRREYVDRLRCELVV
jgi:hypothetical protein